MPVNHLLPTPPAHVSYVRQVPPDFVIFKEGDKQADFFYIIGMWFFILHCFPIVVFHSPFDLACIRAFCCLCSGRTGAQCMP